MKNNFRLNAAATICATTLLLSSCSKGTGPGSSTPTNPNSTSAATSPTPANRATPSARPSGGGTPIDTSKFDSSVAQAESAHQQKPDDGETRLALAHAYLARANALTKAQQYGSALGDFRRTLKYDPQNKSALDMSATIISIFKSLGREAPEEGKEPPPKPYTAANKAASDDQKSY